MAALNKCTKMSFFQNLGLFNLKNTQNRHFLRTLKSDDFVCFSRIRLVFVDQWPFNDLLTSLKISRKTGRKL